MGPELPAGIAWALGATGKWSIWALGLGERRSGRRAQSLLRNRLQQDGRQFVGHFELHESSAGQGVHRPTRIVLQLVVEPGEARGIRGQDIHLLFDATNAARQLYRLGQGGERVRRALPLPKRDHLGTFEADARRGYRRYQPVLARHGGKTQVGRQQAQQGLSVLRHEGVEIDERGNLLRHAVGYATDHHAAIGIADENDIGQILLVDNADHVLNMRVEIDLTVEEVLALADTGQRRSVYFMPRLAQPWRQLPPNHAPSPGAMHQDERRHSFL